jgi:hypothetical protein
MIKKIVIAVSLMLIFYNVSYTQVFPKFSIAGGPIIGYSLNNVDELNAELKKKGIPGLSESGFLALGGRGFIDVPVVPGLRLGGMGLGFSQERSIESPNNIIKTVKYSYGMAGITIEYVGNISEKLDYSIGGTLGIGTLYIDIHQHSKDLQNWNIALVGGDTLSSRNSNSSKYSSKVYSIEPQLGIGYQLLDYLYLNLNVGYSLTAQNNWLLDDALVVKNVPSGIKADGLNAKLGINVGLFVK